MDVPERRRLAPGISSEAEVLTRKAELPTERLDGVARQAVALTQRREFGEMVGIAPEIDDDVGTATPASQRDRSPSETILPGLGDEFSQRRHLGESRRHVS